MSITQLISALLIGFAAGMAFSRKQEDHAIYLLGKVASRFLSQETHIKLTMEWKKEMLAHKNWWFW